MSRRCFSEDRIVSEKVTIGGSEAHHLLHVLRAAPGMNVTLFDGSGVEFEAEVATCKRSGVELRVIERREADRELPFPLTLGVALPKGDRQRWIVEKAVELGVTRLVPLATDRSAVAGERPPGDKLQRYVIEASKQCGRNRLMEISSSATWRQWLDLPSASDDASRTPPPRKWIAHPDCRRPSADDLTPGPPTFIAVGPEGGLTDEEAAAAETAGWGLVGLGPRMLRIETAAMALVSLLTVPCRTVD
jgi:16S rRNA (uracil1498-N3)-methyltransferase